jgi:rSAM/selenodomain-associated transferase 1
MLRGHGTGHHGRIANQQWKGMIKGDETPVVALFVRIPVPGRVKTRLAAHLGKENACRLYRSMVTDILSAIRTSGLPMYLFHDGSDIHHLPKAWQDAACKVIEQQGDGLGERMAAAFQHCFAENNSSVILVGSDIPGLHSQMLLQAGQALQTFDAAIAPVVDGGYCLLALKPESYHHELFQNIPWSTDKVLQATLAVFKQNRIEACMLATLQDIDTIEDLKEFYRRPFQDAGATCTTIADLLHFLFI